MSKNTHYLMDETDAPYEDGERPFPRIIEDDLFLLKLVEENELELKEDSYLYKLLQKIKNEK